jgi:tetratricopeptide (TPR) repeat protein
LKWINECSQKAKDLLKLVDKTAQERLDKARSTKDVRMQAAMLLSLAENNGDQRGNVKREGALVSAQEALPLLQQVGDRKLEASAHLTISRIWFKKREGKKCILAANAGLALFQIVGDQAGEGQCWHCIAAAHVQANRVKDALHAGQKAATLYQTCGDLKLYGKECFSMAKWALMQGDGDQALQSAMEAHKTFKEINYTHGWQSSALQIYVEALAANGMVGQAVHKARQAVRELQKTGEKKEAVFAMTALISAYAHDDDYDNVGDVVDKAMEIAQSLETNSWSFKS